MTDRIALVLGTTIFGAAILDLFVLQSGATPFLARKLADFVEYLAFWR